MTDPIDYSRPVGWWCKATQHDYPLDIGGPPVCSHCIPRYLPIPVGQRPLVDDEVDEAEVVTYDGTMGQWIVADAHRVRIRLPLGSLHRGESIAENINYIVTGATE